MKPNAIATVGVAFVDSPLAIESHLLFLVRRAEMESSAGAALARVAMTQVDPIRFTCDYYSERAAVALPGSFHRFPLALQARLLADLPGCRPPPGEGQ
jgi:hypothetical protein